MLTFLVRDSSSEISHRYFHLKLMRVGAAEVPASAVRMLQRLNPDMSFSLFLMSPDSYRSQRGGQMRLVVCRANGTIHPVFKETMIRTHVANLINYLSSKNESRKFLFTNFKQIFILRIILTTFKYLFFVFYLLGSFF